MVDVPRSSPSDKREARDAVRKGGRVRRRAIANAMRAGWAGEDADEANWLEEAVGAHPGPHAAVLVLYGVAQRLIHQLSEVTGEDREASLNRVLR